MCLPLPHPSALFPGKTLLKVSEAEKRLGAAERDFIHAASLSFLTPLRNFLEGDWRTISVRRPGCSSQLCAEVFTSGREPRPPQRRLLQAEWPRMTLHLWVSVCQGSLPGPGPSHCPCHPCRRRGGSCRTGVLTWTPAKPGSRRPRQPKPKPR